MGVIDDRYASAVISLQDPSSTSSVLTSTRTNGMAFVPLIGGGRFKPSVNSGLEVELPYYSPNLFSFTCHSDDVGPQQAGESYTKWVRNYVAKMEMKNTVGTGYFCEDTAAGEDFMFIRFLGSPYFAV